MYDLTSPNSTTEALHDEAERDRYPRGLEITLDGDTLRKLALTSGDFTVGQVVDLVGQATVTSITASPRQIEDGQSVRLQIVALAFGDEDSTSEEDEPPEDNGDPADLMARRLFG